LIGEGEGRERLGVMREVGSQREGYGPVTNVVDFQSSSSSLVYSTLLTNSNSYKS